MKTERRETGDFGEEAAAAYMKKNGYRILSRNRQYGHPELDIVAENRDYLVFAEVKTRTETEHSQYGPACAAVNREKQRHIIAAARRYIRENPPKKRIRFDVLEVYLRDSETPEVVRIHHIPDAFRA